MNKSPQIFHGEWWVPAVLDHDINSMCFQPDRMMGLESKYTGTLTYRDDKESTLELYHMPSNFRAKLYENNEVMWGMDANGAVFTLFNVVMKEKLTGDFTTTKFEVDFILVGEHVLSLDDARFNLCIVQFPYLKNWAFRNNLTTQIEGNSCCHTLTKPSMDDPFLKSQVEDGVNWILFDYFSQNKTVYDLSINQGTDFIIESTTSVPIRNYLNHIVQFSQFLSIALYCEQNPSEVSFINKDNRKRSELLFMREKSIEPRKTSLIKFDKLQTKIPLVFHTWHEYYDRVSPICKYLVDSLQKKKYFDVPDFLIIAQALDGYHKRFVNKKDGKNHKKYEDGIKILLEQFNDVDFVQKCHIDPIILRDSRNKYSHLYPDDEKSLAVEGDELYWLTEKCKILLTCCILNLMGFTNEEINLCCEESPIQEIVESNPFEFEWYV